jgi:predicted RNA-binding protein with PUA-like domain
MVQSDLSQAQETLHQLGVPRLIKKWNISSGCAGSGPKKNQKKWIGLNVACINAATDEWDDILVREWNPSYKKTGARRISSSYQVKKFIQDASPGDEVFLFCSGLVTHKGIYTGEIKKGVPYDYSPGEKMYCDSRPSTDNVHSPQDGKYRTLDEGFVISVDKWIPLANPFKGAGLMKTLYEVTDKLDVLGNDLYN